MTDESTIKIIKLSTGEEIVCNLVADQHPTLFSVSKPLKLSSIPKLTKQGIEESISLQRWIHFADEDIYDLPKSQVVVITKASYGLTMFYEHCIRKMNAADDNYIPPPSVRDLNDIEDEDLFDLDEYEVSSKLLH
jgi:hypothetical protein